MITPMSHTYCETCNRVRLTADGRLRTCLFGDHEVDLRTPLRDGIPLEPFFRGALAAKPRQHELLKMQPNSSLARSQLNSFRYDWMYDLYLDALRIAGLPES